MNRYVVTRDHAMTDQPDGSVRCSCGATSPRFGTQARAQEWKARHREVVERYLTPGPPHPTDRRTPPDDH